MDDLLVSNSKKARRDKIERPRPDHRPGLIIECYTLEEIKNVYKAIGRYWRAKIPLSWDEDSKNKKLHAEMGSFIPWIPLQILLNNDLEFKDIVGGVASR